MPESLPHASNRDYSGLPHGNLLSPDQRRLQAEQLAAAAMDNYIGIVWKCAAGKHNNLPTILRCVALSCQHVLQQDEYHPVGILYVPMKFYTKKGFYLCRTCFNNFERHKIDFEREMYLTCWMCIMDEATRLTQINPELVRDLRQR